MDFYANQHGLETPDALPESVERMRNDSDRTQSLLREATTRFDETTTMMHDNHKDEDSHRRRSFTDHEAAIISG